MLHAQLIGYGWAFSAAIGNGIQDNLRKYATKSIKNPLHVVAMMEMLNCVTLFLFVFCTGQGELIFGKRKPLFRQKNESSRSYSYENDDGVANGYYTDLTDAGVYALANGCPSLTAIDLSSRVWFMKPDDITRTAFDAFCKSHPRLEAGHNCRHDWNDGMQYDDFGGYNGYSGLWG